MGRYHEAEELCLLAIEIREARPDPEDLDLADSLQNLGEIYALHLERPADAEAPLRRALMLRERFGDTDGEDYKNGVAMLNGVLENLERE